MCDGYIKRYDCFMAKNILEEVIKKESVEEFKAVDKDYVLLSMKAVTRDNYLGEKIASDINTYQDFISQLKYFTD